MKRFPRLQQRGFTFVEVAASILIISVLSALTAQKTFADLLDVTYTGVGQQVDQHRQALENYIFGNYADLTDPARDPIVTANTGVATPLSPTFAELAAAPQKYIPQLMNIGGTTMYGQTMTYKVYRQGVCPGASCNVFGLAYPSTPFRLPNGQINDGAAMTAMAAMGARGGVAYASAPATVKGYGGAWSQANPIAFGGVVFGLSGGNLNYLNGFYKKAGDTLLGQMNAGGQNIINGQNFTYDAFIDRGNATFSVRPSGISTLNTVNMADGKVSARSSSAKLSSLLGQYIHKANYIQGQNTTVPQPICPDSGTPNIDVIPQRALSTDGYQIPAPTNNGSSWTVVILDSSSTQIPGATFLARTYCYYP